MEHMEGMELRIYLDMIRKWLWLIVLCTILASGSAYVFSRQQAPIYQASIKLLINNESNGRNFNQTFVAGQRLVATYSERLMNSSVKEEVMEILQLDKWSAKISVTPIRDTGIFTLNVEDSNPELAMKIANLMPEVFVRQNDEKQQERMSNREDILAKELEKIREQMDTTYAAIDDLLSKKKKANQAKSDRLQADLNQYKNSYDFFIRNYQDLRMAQAQMFTPLLVEEPAKQPTVPISPRIWMNTLLGAIVGALIGLGAGFLIEYLDDTIKPMTDLRGIFGVGTLGLIGRIEQQGERVLVHTLNRRTGTEEAYRMLRTNIRFTSVDKPLRTLLVTSSKPAEGKSSISANLAVAMAQEGHRVILVDADLRKPVQHKIFNITRKQGLTTALVERESAVEELLVDSEVEGLRLLTSGPIPPNPSELLGSQRMREILSELQEQADIVLLDSAPLLAVADSSLLASVVSGVLLVLRANKTNLGSTQAALEQLASVQANLIGTVLNDVDTSASGYYYYYYNSDYGTPSDPDGPSDTSGKRKRDVSSLVDEARALLFNIFIKS